LNKNKIKSEKYKTISIPVELWGQWENFCSDQLIRDPRTRILVLLENIIKKENKSNENI
jgi:hypothetical protein